LTGVVVMLLSVAGCCESRKCVEAGSIQSLARDDDVISVGMERDSVLARVEKAGAEDIRRNVGIRPASDIKLSWYEQRDGTLLHLRFEEDMIAKRWVLTAIIAGNPGQGYGDKIVFLKWSDKPEHSYQTYKLRR
jgi:hypothetical protein